MAGMRQKLANDYDEQLFKEQDVGSHHEHQLPSSSSLKSSDLESNLATPSLRSRLLSWSTMRSNLILVMLSAVMSWLFLFGPGAYAAPGIRQRLSTTTVDAYSSFEYPLALDGINANIGPSGSKSQGAAPGVVIAAPSTCEFISHVSCQYTDIIISANPNYLYTWIRDSSLTYKYFVDRYVSGRDTTLLDSINTWISSMATIQQVSNPSGTVSTGGLGEPKFLISEQAFTGSLSEPDKCIPY
jgi:glucoamylase